MGCRSTPTLPGDWRFDASSSSFVTGDAVIRVHAVPASEAALLDGAQTHVEQLHEDLYKIESPPGANAKTAAARGFQESPDPIVASRPARTVLVYYDTTPDAPSDRVAAYTRVTFDGERVIISAIPVSSALLEEAQHQVLEAVVLASEELALIMAREAISQKAEKPEAPMMVWRSQIGASDELKKRLEREGYSTSFADRVEMTAYVKALGSADAPIEAAAIDGVECRPLDLANDNLVAVFDVLKDAFGPVPPSFEAWKRHYIQHPRLAPDLSVVAWQGATPIAVSLMELMVDGEGGGDDEIFKIYTTDASLDDAIKRESLSQPLVFPDDYKARRESILARATTAQVCHIATAPAFRGKRLAHELLLRNFQAAARAGLDVVTLGVDRQNPGALRAYTRAGMVETNVKNLGWATGKVMTATP